MALKRLYKKSKVTAGPVVKEDWMCSVAYTIRDISKDLTIAQYTNKACYSSIWYDIYRHLKANPTSINSIAVKYWCKKSGLAVRLPIIEYVCRKFSHFFKSMTIDIDKSGEVVVEVVSKPSTPLEMFFGLGAFLRLSWEQWSNTYSTDPETYLVQALSVEYELHIPLALYIRAYNTTNFNDHFKDADMNDKLDCLRLVFKILRYHRVFQLPLSSLTPQTNLTPYMQLRCYNALRRDVWFAERFPDLFAKFGED